MGVLVTGVICLVVLSTIVLTFMILPKKIQATILDRIDHI